MARAQHFSKSSTRGFTLTEVAIVLCIFSIILGGIWAYTSSMKNSLKHEQFSQLLVTLTNNIRGSYAGRTSFDHTNADTMMPLLMQKGVFPADMVKRTGTRSVAISPFGEFTPSPTGNLTYKSIYICGWKAKDSTSCVFGGGEADVPLFAIETVMKHSDCITAAVRNSNPVHFPGLVGVYVNGAQVLPLPVTTGAAADACRGGTGVSYIDFVFKLVP